MMKGATASNVNVKPASAKAFRYSLLSTSFILMFIVAIVIGGIGFVSLRRVVNESIVQQLAAASDYGSAKVEGWLQSHISQVEEMARSMQIKSLKQYTVNKYLAEALNIYTDYSSFWLSDMDGNWYSPLGTSGSIASREYFPVVKQKQQSVVSNPLIGQADGQLVVVLAIPVFNDEGRMVSVLGANLRLSSLVDFINEIKIGETGSVVIFEHGGLTVVDKDASKALKYSPFDDPEHAFSKFKGDLLSARRAVYNGEIDGENSYFVPRRMDLTDWIMIAVAKTEEFNAPLYEAMRRVAIGIIITLVLAFLYIMYYANKTIRPLDGISGAITGMKRGDLTIGTGIKTRGPVSRIARYLDEVRETMRTMIGDVVGSVDRVAVEVDRISNDAENITRYAEQTSAGSREIMENCRRDAESAARISDAIGQISESIAKVDDSMRSISESADRTVDLADKGNKEVMSVIAQMDKIRAAVDTASSVITKVGDSSRHIGEIVATIASISKQTNLLAVNASIEAARAGEQGRGFAVVAGEVGKLAGETSDATEKISALANEMVTNTEEAIESIESGTQEVRVGANVVGDAGRAFSSIQQVINSLQSQLREMTDDVRTIAAERQELLAASSGIKDSVAATSARSEKATEAMDEQLALVAHMMKDTGKLRDLAGKLREDTGIFRT